MSTARRERLILICVGLIVAGILLVLVFMPRHEKEWEAMRKHLDQVASETKIHKSTRSVLRGHPIPGNAWSEYDAAIRELQGPARDNAESRALRQIVSSGMTIDRDAADQLLALRSGALEHLEFGARRPDGRFPYDWNRPYLTSVPRMAPELTLVATAQAKVWIESGRTEDAVDVLLDVMAFGRDLATNAPLWADLNGMSAYSLALDQLGNLIRSGRLTPAELEALREKLDIVARDFPTVSSALAGEALATNASMIVKSPNAPILEFRYAVDLAGTAANRWWDLAREGSWRYSFSEKGMAVDAFKQKEALLQRSQSLDQADYASARKEADALTAEVESSKNPLLRRTMPSFSIVLISHRGVLARLSLLRAGVASLATGDVPTLPDPFGENLQHRQENGKTKIWSIGTNGKDDNGLGDWLSTSPQPDIVLEIKNSL